MKKTVVFIGTLEEKEIVEKPNDGKCEVIHRSEPHFLATGFLVQISSPQFSQDEFNDRLTAQNLRKIITTDLGDILLNHVTDPIDWLNKLIRVPDFYDKISTKKNIKTLDSDKSKYIQKLERAYNNSKSEIDLRRLNRSLIEIFYPNETPKSLSVYYLVTAKHVVFDRTKSKMSDENLFIFYNLKSGLMKHVPISDIKKKYNTDWVFHNNPEVDIALIPFDLNIDTDDIVIIDDSMFLSRDKLLETYDVIFFSFQPGTEYIDLISPVIRRGMISRFNTDGTFYIDGFAFPGNSGSPVFVKAEAVRLGEKNFSGNPFGDPLGSRFIGIIGQYVPYEEMAISEQTKRPRILFEENTGLSKVWPVDLINEIIESVRFRNQVNKIYKKLNTSP